MNNFKRTSKLTDDADDVVLASEVLAAVEVELVSEVVATVEDAWELVVLDAVDVDAWELVVLDDVVWGNVVLVVLTSGVVVLVEVAKVDVDDVVISGSSTASYVTLISCGAVHVPPKYKPNTLPTS